MTRRRSTPFVLQEWHAGGTLHVRLANTRTREQVTFFPELGGAVSTLELETDTGLLSVLCGYGGKEDYNLDTRYRGIHLIPFANRIRDGKYTFQGRVYQLPVNDAEHQHAHHGFLADRVMSLAGVNSGSDSIAATLEYRYSGDYPGYPFPFAVRLRYSLAAGGRFSCRTTMVNTGPAPMPVSPGWHPYYTLGGSMEDLELRLPACRHTQIDNRMMPTGVVRDVGDRTIPLRGAQLDHLFLLPHDPGIATVRLVGKGGKPGLRIWQETGPGKYNAICVYTPPSRDSVAIEPMTGGINAFNSGEGRIVLPPGGTFSGRFGVAVLRNNHEVVS